MLVWRDFVRMSIIVSSDVRDHRVVSCATVYRDGQRRALWYRLQQRVSSRDHGPSRETRLTRERVIFARSR